jgi:hypothetical protein
MKWPAEPKLGERRLEPLVGLAPTNTSLRNSPCCFWRHRGFENGALTWICTTSFRLRKPACRTNYTLRAIGIEPRLASVIGLAPIRPGLKDRLLELLCIHGLKIVAAEDENTESLLAGRR